MNFRNSVSILGNLCLKKSISRNFSQIERPTISQAGNMMDIGCRKIFQEEHDMFRESVRKFIATEILPYHEKWEKNGRVDREAWLKAGENGLLGVAIPEEDYGIGGDLLSSAIVLEELCYANCSGPGFALHSDVVMPYISNYGTKAQKEKYLPKMTSGEFIGALGMTEPSAGSDLQRIVTKAVPDGKGNWILNGSKVFISNGQNCDVIVAVAITDPKAKSPAHGISLFLVNNDMKGFKKGKILNKMGLKAQDTSELFFEDVKLTKEDLLGEENKGFYYLMHELPRERLFIGITSQAGAEFVFEDTRQYLKERKAFKGTLSNLQAIQHKMAELKTAITVSRSFIDDCLFLCNENKLDAESASMAKYYASDLFNEASDLGVQYHGGWGYMWEYQVCKAYVDARVQSIYGGANEIMKELISRTIFK